MSLIDIGLAVFLVLGGYQGYKSGFLLELFSVTAVILGVLGAFKLMGWAMVFLANKTKIDEKVLPYVAFGVVFLLIVIAVTIVGRIIKASIKRSIFGQGDGFAGGLLGVVRTAFMLSVTFWIIDALKFKVLSNWTAGSWLYPQVAAFAPRLTHWVSQALPVFDDVF